MTLRSQSNLQMFYRGIAAGLALMLCLPAPDLLAQPSAKSIFAGKQASHGAVRQRNLQELNAKQGMVGKEKPSTDHGASSVVPSKPLSLASLQDLSALNIPQEDGQILEVWQPDTRDEGQVVGDETPGDAVPSLVTRPPSPGSRPTVILLQDLHTQPEAQKAEGNILQHLFKTYNVRFVASEGAADPFDLEFFQQFPQDKELRTRVAETFLQLGEMTGHEYQAIVEQLPVAMQGVDDPALYTEDLEVFRSALARQLAVQQALEAVGGALRSIEASVVHESLQALLLDERRFEQGTLALPDYASRLLAITQRIGVDADALAPNVVQLLRLAAMEKALPLRDEIHRQQQALVQAVTEAAQAAGHRAQAPALAELLRRLQAGQVGTAYAFERLTQLAAESGVALEEYPAVQVFAEYLHQSRSLQTHALMAELDRLMATLGDRLAQTDDERAWWTLCRTHRLFIDAIGLTLTRVQLAAYRQQRSSFASIVEFCAAHGHRVEDELSVVDAFLPTIERFYELAEQRDRAMVDNTLRWVQEQATGGEGQARPAAQTDAVLLIAGGFHTEGMTALLRERQVPYVVVTPTAAGALDEALYHRLVEGKTASIEEWFAVARASGVSHAMVAPESFATVRPASSSPLLRSAPEGREFVGVQTSGRLSKRAKWIIGVMVALLVLGVVVGAAHWQELFAAAHELDPQVAIEVVSAVDAMEPSVAPFDAMRDELTQLQEMLRARVMPETEWDAGVKEVVVTASAAEMLPWSHGGSKDEGAQDRLATEKMNEYTWSAKTFADRHVAEGRGDFADGVQVFVRDVLLPGESYSLRRLRQTLEALTLSSYTGGEAQSRAFQDVAEIHEALRQQAQALGDRERYQFYVEFVGTASGKGALLGAIQQMEQNLEALRDLNAFAQMAIDFANQYRQVVPDATVPDGIAAYVRELQCYGVWPPDPAGTRGGATQLSAMMGHAAEVCWRLREQHGADRRLTSLVELRELLSSGYERAAFAGLQMQIIQRAGETAQDSDALRQCQQESVDFLRWLEQEGRSVFVGMAIGQQFGAGMGQLMRRLGRQLHRRTDEGALAPIHYLSQAFLPSDHSVMLALSARSGKAVSLQTEKFARRMPQSLQQLPGRELQRVDGSLEASLAEVLRERFPALVGLAVYMGVLPERGAGTEGVPAVWLYRDQWGLFPDDAPGGVMVLHPAFWALMQRELSGVQTEPRSSPLFDALGQVMARMLIATKESEVEMVSSAETVDGNAAEPDLQLEVEAAAVEEILTTRTGLSAKSGRWCMTPQLAPLALSAWPSAEPGDGPGNDLERVLWELLVADPAFDVGLRARVFGWLAADRLAAGRREWPSCDLAGDQRMLQEVLLVLTSLMVQGRIAIDPQDGLPVAPTAQRKPKRKSVALDIQAVRSSDTANIQHLEQGLVGFAGRLAAQSLRGEQLSSGAYGMAVSAALRAASTMLRRSALETGFGDFVVVHRTILVHLVQALGARDVAKPWETFVQYCYAASGRVSDGTVVEIVEWLRSASPADREKVLREALSKGEMDTVEATLLGRLEWVVRVDREMKAMTPASAYETLVALTQEQVGGGAIDVRRIGLAVRKLTEPILAERPVEYGGASHQPLEAAVEIETLLGRVEEVVPQDSTSASMRGLVKQVQGARRGLRAMVEMARQQERQRLYKQGRQTLIGWMGEPSAAMEPLGDPTFPPLAPVWGAVRDLGGIREFLSLAEQREIDEMLVRAGLFAARLEGEELEFFQDVRRNMSAVARRRVDRTLLQQWVDQGEQRYGLRPATVVAAGSVIDGLTGPMADSREAEAAAVLLARVVEKIELGGETMEDFAQAVGRPVPVAQDFCNHARESFRMMAVPLLLWWSNLNVKARRVAVYGSQPIVEAVRLMARDESRSVAERLGLLETIWRAAGGLKAGEKVPLGEDRLDDLLVRTAAETEMARLQPSVESSELKSWRGAVQKWLGISKALRKGPQAAPFLVQLERGAALRTQLQEQDIALVCQLQEAAPVHDRVCEMATAVVGAFARERLRTWVERTEGDRDPAEAVRLIGHLAWAIRVGGQTIEGNDRAMLQQVRGSTQDGVIHAAVDEALGPPSPPAVELDGETRWPNRFRVEVWRAFKAKLQALEDRFAGLAELVEQYGLAWTDPQGRVHFIDEVLRIGKYDEVVVNRVWMAAQDALNEMASEQGDATRRFEGVADVKRMIGYHESLHAQFSDRMHQALIHHFRRRMEEIVGAFPAESDQLLQHPFFAAMSAVYGDPPNMQAMSVDELINWYVEEALVQSIQEGVWFNDPGEVWRRLSVAQPSLASHVAALQQEVDQVVQLVGWDDIRPVVWDSPPAHDAASGTVLLATDRQARALASPWSLSRSYLVVWKNGLPYTMDAVDDELLMVMKDQPSKGYPPADWQQDPQLFYLTLGARQGQSDEVVLGNGGPNWHLIDPQLAAASSGDAKGMRGKMSYVWWKLVLEPFLAERAFGRLSMREVAALFEFVERRGMGKVTDKLFQGALAAARPVDEAQMGLVEQAYADGRVGRLSEREALRRAFPATYAAVHDFLSIESPSELRTYLEVFEAWGRIWLVEPEPTGQASDFRGAVARQEGAFRGMYLPRMTDQPEVLGETLIRLLAESANLPDAEIQILIERYRALRTGDHQVLREQWAMAAVVRELSMLPLGSGDDWQSLPSDQVMQQLGVVCSEAVAVVQGAGDQRQALLPQALAELEAKRPTAGQRVRQWLAAHANDASLQQIFGAAALLIIGIGLGLLMSHGTPALHLSAAVSMTVAPGVQVTSMGERRMWDTPPYERAMQSLGVLPEPIATGVMGDEHVYLAIEPMTINGQMVDVTVRYLDREADGEQVVAKADRFEIDLAEVAGVRTSELSADETRRVALNVIDAYYVRRIRGELGSPIAFVDQTRVVAAGHSGEHRVYRPSPELLEDRGSLLETEGLVNELCQALDLPAPPSLARNPGEGFGWRALLPGHDLGDKGSKRWLLFGAQDELPGDALLRRAEQMGRWAAVAVLLRNGDVDSGNIVVRDDADPQHDMAVIDPEVICDTMHFEPVLKLNTGILLKFRDALSLLRGIDRDQVTGSHVASAFVRGFVLEAQRLSSPEGRAAIGTFLRAVEQRGGLMVRLLVRGTHEYRVPDVSDQPPVPHYTQWLDASSVMGLVSQQADWLQSIASGKELLVAGVGTTTVQVMQMQEVSSVNGAVGSATPEQSEAVEVWIRFLNNQLRVPSGIALEMDEIWQDAAHAGNGLHQQLEILGRTPAGVKAQLVEEQLAQLPDQGARVWAWLGERGFHGRVAQMVGSITLLKALERVSGRPGVSSEPPGGSFDWYPAVMRRVVNQIESALRDQPTPEAAAGVSVNAVLGHFDADSYTGEHVAAEFLKKAPVSVDKPALLQEVLRRLERREEAKVVAWLKHNWQDERLTKLLGNLTFLLLLGVAAGTTADPILGAALPMTVTVATAGGSREVEAMPVSDRPSTGSASAAAVVRTNGSGASQRLSQYLQQVTFLVSQQAEADGRYQAYIQQLEANGATVVLQSTTLDIQHLIETGGVIFIGELSDFGLSERDDLALYVLNFATLQRMTLNDLISAIQQQYSEEMILLQRRLATKA